VASPVDLAPCPFCGGAAEFERRGTGRQSCIVVCGDCGARHESGDSGDRCGSSWNRRESSRPSLPMPLIHSHGLRCPCEGCAYINRRNASAVWWLARGLRRLAGFDQGGN
jgi:Lar family restriction alleviation protein